MIENLYLVFILSEEKILIKNYLQCFANVHLIGIFIAYIFAFLFLQIIQIPGLNSSQNLDQQVYQE